MRTGYISWGVLAAFLSFFVFLNVPAALGQSTVPVVAANEATTAPLLTKAATAKSLAATPKAGEAIITDEMAARAAGILLLFVIVAVGIATRKLPAMVALPLMALGIGLIAGVRLFGSDGILATILEGKTAERPSGAFQLYKAIIYVLFGGMFARFISDAKIAERIVKYAAEYGGEDPYLISLLMSGISIVVFTATGGLPMIIMLGTVMFPIMLSLGVPAVVAGSMLLLAFPIGSCLNPAEWARTADVFGVQLATIRTYFLVWASIQAVVLLAFLTIEFLRMRRTTVRPGGVLKSLAKLLLCVSPVAVVVWAEPLAGMLNVSAAGLQLISEWKLHGLNLLQWGFTALLITGVIHSQVSYRFQEKQTLPWNLLTPILPLVFLLVLGFNDAIIPAFLASIAYGFLTTPQDRGMQKLSRSIIHGVSDVAAPVVLMAGIGMLIAAATHPVVNGILTPVLAQVVPTSRSGYVLFFLLAAPLALYRGPLNEFGLGIGIAKLMQTFMPAPATMGALRAVGMLQDPTTTQNIWICGYLKLDINALLFKLFLYSMVLVVVGLLLSAYMFFPGK